MKFRHIRSRIAFFMCALTILSLGISWLVTFVYFRKILSEQVINDNRVIVQKAAERIENELEYVRRYAQTISYDKNFQKSLRESYGANAFARNAAAQQTALLLSDYAVLNKGIIYDIFVVNRTGDYSMGNTLGRYDALVKEPWFTELVRYGADGSFSRPHATLSKSNTAYQVETISFVGQVKDLEDMGQLLGTLVVNMDLSRLFADLRPPDDSHQAYYMVDEENSVFYGLTDPAPDFSGFEGNRPVQRRAGYYFISEPVSALKAHLVGVVPEKQVSQAMMGSMAVLFLSLFCGLLIAAIFVVVLSKSITRPIVALSEGMKKSVQQSFKLQLGVTGRDELAQMTELFNDMQQQTRQLMQQKKEMGKRDRELRMKYFMSKINPHFIYNTLNCVIYLARKGDSGEIIPLTRALIAILKTNIAVGESPITLSEEMDYLSNYFYILKYRYNDQIQIRFEIPQGLMSLKIQPMILYPLVENSVFHGIAPSGEPGQVCVRVYEEGERLYFEVSDNGVGMSQEKLTELDAYIHSETGRNIYGSIGLRNVNHRLRLFYSSCGGLELESGEGTRMWFSIGKKELTGL